jgi:beta-glucanase (GH16 family)
MRRWHWCCAILAVVLAGVLAPVEFFPVERNQAAEPPADRWKLVWSDEFDGKEIDRAKWNFDSGNGFYDYNAQVWVAGWGNNELQYYTREPDNAFVSDGMLHIRALKESHQGFGYTSARLKTRHKDGRSLFSQKYGRFEFRAKLPTGRGMWPALWMLPQDEKYGGWPLSGEIDVMEARGQEPNKVLGTLHFGSPWPGNTHISNDYILPRDGTIADFHIYAVEWEPGEIRWNVDDHCYATQSFWWSSRQGGDSKAANPTQESDLNPWPAPFDQPFYLVMNLAVGGKFLGNPDRTTVFPAEMLVDYVRVYEKVDGYGRTKPRGEGKLPFAR